MCKHAVLASIKYLCGIIHLPISAKYVPDTAGYHRVLSVAVTVSLVQCCLNGVIKFGDDMVKLLAGIVCALELCCEIVGWRCLLERLHGSLLASPDPNVPCLHSSTTLTESM